MKLKDYSSEICLEIERIKKECMKWDRIKRKEIKDKINKNQSILKCTVCEKELEVDNSHKWDVHAKLHMLDKSRYLLNDNSMVVCKSCHTNLKEKYELSDGTVKEYSRK